MDADDEQNLSPNETILSGLFSGVKPIETKILAQTYNACTFAVQFGVETPPGLPRKVLVRLEKSQDRLHNVAALQKLAALRIRDIVPETFDIGTVTTQDGSEVEYSITEFFDDSVELESVWEELDSEQQSTLMDAVVQAMAKIQTLRLDDESVQTVLKDTPYLSGDGSAHQGSLGSIKHALGGPEIGYFEDIASFLDGIITSLNPKKKQSSIKQSSEGTVLESAFEDVGRIEFSPNDLQALLQQTVFCHNDIEPRNILVRQVGEKEGKQNYELTAIIDWEMAGFFPFSFEFALKDSILGSKNLSFSWYAMFKKRAISLLSPEEFHTKLVKAVAMIHESHRRNMTKNVGERVRVKWIERERLEKDSDVRNGWVRRADAGSVGPFGKADNEKLELEVLRELGYIS